MDDHSISSDDSIADSYDAEGNYIGKKEKVNRKEEALYGEFLRHSPDREQRKRGRSKKEADYTKPVKYRGVRGYVRGETLVNKATRETMVKPGVKKKVEVSKEEEDEQRKEKFKKQMQEMPTLFGKGGSKADVSQTIENQRLKREEKKYEMYGKGHKFLKNMGFTADQHIEIVHAVKRQNGLGLGAKDPKGKQHNPDLEKGRKGFEYGQDGGMNKTKKPV